HFPLSQLARARRAFLRRHSMILVTGASGMMGKAVFAATLATSCKTAFPIMPLAPVTKIILCLLRNARRARASWESGKCRPELLSNHIHPRQAGLEAFLLAVLEKAVARGDSSMGRRWVHPGSFG